MGVDGTAVVANPQLAVKRSRVERCPLWHVDGEVGTSLAPGIGSLDLLLIDDAESRRVVADDLGTSRVVRVVLKGAEDGELARLLYGAVSSADVKLAMFVDEA